MQKCSECNHRAVVFQVLRDGPGYDGLCAECLTPRERADIDQQRREAAEARLDTEQEPL